jgi:cob(I)alamin adenosyltransferase
MAIYTKTGDRGQTSLATGERVSKTDLRLEAYGTADELNSWIGLLRAAVSSGPSAVSIQHSTISNQLEWVQQRLFNIGAALSGAPGEWINEEDVHELEQWIDRMLEEAPLVRAFVLPAGSEPVARAHVCRTVTRRLERRILAMDETDQWIVQYVNRLSDYLFVLAEYFARKGGEKPQIWEKTAKCKN